MIGKSCSPPWLSAANRISLMVAFPRVASPTISNPIGVCVIGSIASSSCEKMLVPGSLERTLATGIDMKLQLSVATAALPSSHTSMPNWAQYSPPMDPSTMTTCTPSSSVP